MTLTEVSNILHNTLVIGLGVTLWIYLYGLFSMFLRFIWDCCKEYKLRKEMERRYIDSLIEKGLQKEQEELLAQVQKQLEMGVFQEKIREKEKEELLAQDKIREAEFKEKVANRKDGEIDVDCDN